MKGIAAVILMVLLSVQTFSKWMWVLDYQLNKAYIARTLCVNKAKPMLHCNGQCQLQKKLADDENSNKTSNNAVPKQNLNLVFFKSEVQTVLLTGGKPDRQWTSFYMLNSYTAPRAALFHPPTV